MTACYILRLPDTIQEILDRLDGNSALSFVSTCQLMHSRWRGIGLLCMCLTRMNYHKDAIAFVNKEDPEEIIEMLNFSAFLETSCVKALTSSYISDWTCPFDFERNHMAFKRGPKGLGGIVFINSTDYKANYEITKIKYSRQEKRYIHLKLSNLDDVKDHLLYDVELNEYMVICCDVKEGGKMTVKSIITLESFKKFKFGIDQGFDLIPRLDILDTILYYDGFTSDGDDALYRHEDKSEVYEQKYWSSTPIHLKKTKEK